MGWKSSPPNFCAFTETIADLANASLLSTGLPHARLQPHRLDALSKAPTHRRNRRQPSSLTTFPNLLQPHWPRPAPAPHPAKNQFDTGISISEALSVYNGIPMPDRRTIHIATLYEYP
eukprot:jgi/Psemu1/52034/gm1.52034_g